MFLPRFLGERLTPRSFSGKFENPVPAGNLIIDTVMGRENRPNFPGGMYHVMNRGNRKAVIFEDDRDRRRFVRIVREEQEIHGVKLLAGSLMDNHFHMGVLTPHANLSEFMQRVEGRFAQYSNWRHHRVGHVFQGRFRHVVLEHDVHLLTALCYIFMNPVVAGLVDKLEACRWSTYAATAGFKPIPSNLTLDWLEALFPTLHLEDARLRFRELMSDTRPVAAYIQDLELDVSGETIGQVVRSYTNEQLHLASLPSVYRTALRPAIDTLWAQAKGDRRAFVREARVSFGYRNAEIAKPLHLKPSTVSNIFRADRRQG